MARREWSVPLIGIVIAVVAYLVLLALIASNDARWGTVAEWIGAVGAIFVGIATALIAGFAWQEAKAAREATERAVRAEERGNMLMEQQLASTVVFSIKATKKWDVAYLLQVETSERSPTLWLRGGTVKMVGGDTPDGAPPDQITLWANQLQEAIDMLRGIHLASGGTTECLWFFGDIDPREADPFHATVSVSYSVTSGKDATQFDSPSITLEMPE